MRTTEIPADQCMFALLDSPRGRGRQARAELLYQFEALLPDPIETFHAVFSPLSEGRVVACACDRGRLDEVRARFERAIPESLPSWLGLDDPDDAVRSHLNLLTGPAVPLARVQRERTTAKLVCFCAIALLMVVWLGVQRRTQQHGAESDRISGQIAELYDAVLPPAGPGAQPAAVRFAARMNRVSATRTGTAPQIDRNPAAGLASVLAAWPAQAEAQTRGVIATSDAVRLQVSLPSNEAAGLLLAELRGTAGWEIHSHSMTPRADRVELSVRLGLTQAPDERVIGAGP